MLKLLKKKKSLVPKIGSHMWESKGIRESHMWNPGNPWESMGIQYRYYKWIQQVPVYFFVFSTSN